MLSETNRECKKGELFEAKSIFKCDSRELSIK